MSGAALVGVIIVIAVLVGAIAFYAGQATASRVTTITSISTVGGGGGGGGNNTDQMLYQQAKNEGSLVVYGSIDSDQFNVFANAFSALYPGINVQYTNFSPSQAYTRITSEISASGHSADLVIVDGLVPQLQAAGDVTPYVAPAAASWPKSSFDNNVSTPIVFLPMTMVYNTKMVSQSQLPKTLTDLTNPQWKGKIALHDPTLGTGGTHYWATLSTVLGNSTVTNFLTQLKANTNPTLEHSPGGTESDVANGQYAIGMEVYMTDVVGDIQNNASIAVLPIQGVPVVLAPSDAAILKGAQHPNAAKLLIDFLASSTGQTVIGNITNVLPQGSIRIPVDPNVKTAYTVTSLISKYQPGATVVTMPASIYNGNSYKNTYTSIFNP